MKFKKVYNKLFEVEKYVCDDFTILKVNTSSSRHHYPKYKFTAFYKKIQISISWSSFKDAKRVCNEVLEDIMNGKEM